MIRRHASRARRHVPGTGPLPAALAMLTRTGSTQSLSFVQHGFTVSATIALPSGYDPTASTTYPVYWMLHGKGGTANAIVTTWLVQFNAAVAAGLCPAGIVVIPDFGPQHWYTNSKDGTSPARSMLNWLRARIRRVTRASASWTDWHIQGFSMGGFGAASWFADEPERWGSVVVNGGANLDSTTGNNWATADAADFISVFGSDAAYLARESPAQKWAAIASTITASDVPIRVTLGASDTTVSASIAAFRSALTSAGIWRWDVSIPSATHTLADYFNNDTTNGPLWAGAVMYSIEGDTSTWNYYIDVRKTGSYTLSGTTVTSFVNLMTGASISSGVGPTLTGTAGAIGAAWSFDGSTQGMYGAETAVTNEANGSDQPCTFITVSKMTSPDATAAIFGFTNTAGNAAWYAATNTTGNGRQRLTKIDDAAGSSTAARAVDQGSLVQVAAWVTASGVAANGYRDDGAADPSAAAFDRGTTTLNRIVIGALIRNSGPTITERLLGEIRACLFAGSEVSTTKRTLATTKLLQRHRAGS